MKLDGLRPERVFYWFERICEIPHPSGHERQISDFLVEFAREHDLEYVQDELYNVIIKKPAAKGQEHREPVILQGHMDMVAEQESDCDRDMENEGLDIFIDDGFVTARGTTLGGDDGIALAYSLAILEDDNLKTPPLEVIFTISEETGMDGAHGIDLSSLSGRRLFNLDSEEEGVMLTSCAGGGRLSVSLELEREAAPEEGLKKTISISGLLGGHSGEMIDKYRANAIILSARLLRRILWEMDVRILSLYGGGKDNAIPRDCSISICIAADDRDRLSSIIKDEEKKIKDEYESADPGISIIVSDGDAEETDSADMPVSLGSTKKAVALLLALPNGLMRMSDFFEGLPETSLNAGILELKGDTLRVSYALRSAVGSAYEALRDNMIFVAEGFGAKAKALSEYPAWEFVADSPLRTKMCQIYKDMTGNDMKVESVHGGLECGIISNKIPGIDVVSFGPDILDIHTPKERLDIASTERVYDYLCRVLEEI